MSRQRFTTTDVLALDVLATYPPMASPNLIVNPSGDLGAWGWLSPHADTRVRTHTGGHGLRFETTAAGVPDGVTFLSELVAVDGAAWGKAQVDRIASSGNYSASGGVMPVIRINFYDVDRTYLGQSSTASGGQVDGSVAIGYGPAPADVAYLALEVKLLKGGGGALPSGAYVVLDDVVMIGANNSLMVAHPGWVDILGPSLEVGLERVALDVGVLTATIRDATLDPATATTIRKGKPLRCLLAGGQLITATIRDAKVSYALLEDDPEQRATITLTALDATIKPAGVSSPAGVATVAELAHLFEGAGTPWNLNGDTGHATGVPVEVSTNPSATLLDQVALTRDTVLGYAWVDRLGAVNVWHADTLAANPAKVLAAVLDEDRYTDLVLDYDTDWVINSVGIKYLRLDPVTGETEEVAYGPFVDEASVRQWDLHHEDFTVHGLDEDALDDYAGAILAANATPRRIATQATLTLATDADLDDFGLVDLYDGVNVVNARAGLDEVLRVVSITHRITHNRWSLVLGFATEDTVAMPQLLTAPPSTAVATLAQLLRPVGEVTVMLGLPSQVWPGWLLLNGAALTPGEYPELEAWLAAGGLSTTVLPDFTDRIVVGAGIKAVGAKTGAWTKTIAANNLPVHDHAAGTLAVASVADKAAGTQNRGGNPITGRTGNASYSGTAANDLDITPPVVAAYWVIRARSGA